MFSRRRSARSTNCIPTNPSKLRLSSSERGARASFSSAVMTIIWISRWAAQAWRRSLVRFETSRSSSIRPPSGHQMAQPLKSTTGSPSSSGVTTGMAEVFDRPVTTMTVFPASWARRSAARLRGSTSSSWPRRVPSMSSRIAS